MTDCPNCGQQVDETAALCPNCGFDLHSQQAGEVRRLREEGKIHPGVIDPGDRDVMAGGDPRERQIRTDLPSEDLGREGPEEFDAGL